MKRFFTHSTYMFFMLACTLAAMNTVQAQTDAGVNAILVPTNPACAGSQSISAEITNYGAQDITSLDIEWAVNGVVQTTVNWNGTLVPLDMTTVNLGNFTFAAGTTYQIRANTANPNGGVDNDNSNDTTTLSGLTVRMSGMYTIGGSSPDFARFNDAITALNANGVCGPVVFNMRPQLDTLQAELLPVTGADAVNTITFQAENGDATSVTLLYPSQPAFTPTNYLLKLNGADYFHFNNITMSRPGIEPYARVVEFTNNATFNTISNCRIIGAVNTITNSLSALIYASAGSPSLDSNNTFTGNQLENGSLGIYMNGLNAQNLESNLVITNNVLLNQFSKGIQLSNQAYAMIRNNQINTNSIYAGYAGMYLDRCQRDQVVSKNKIIGIPGTGIYMVDCSGFNTVPGLVVNNFIQCSDSAGISMINGDYQELVYNTIHMTGTNPSFTALAVRGVGTGKVIRNNILANTGGGYSYIVSDSAIFGIISSDYNDLYATGPNRGNWNGTNAVTLANWVSLSQHDTNSVGVDPRFISATDLHATANNLNNLGSPYPAVQDDIDGDVRSATTPDIGADEFNPVIRDLSVTAILSPTNGSCGAAATQVKLIIQNVGGLTETGFTVHCVVSGSIAANLMETYSQNLLAGAIDTITFSTTLATGGGVNLDLLCYVALGPDDDRSNDTLRSNVNLLAQPAAPIAINDSICGTGSASLTAVASDTLRWYNAANGGNFLGSGSPFSTPVITATTTFYVSNKGTCESDRVAVDAVVLPVPAVSLGNDQAVLAGTSVTFDAGPGFSSYSWSNGATTQTITVNTEDCYSVVVTNNFNCSNTDTVCLIVVQPYDVGVTAIVSPANGDCANTAANVSVTVRNFGTNVAVQIPIEVDITGFVTANFRDTIRVTMTPGTSITRTLGTVNIIAGGTLHVTAFTAFSADLDPNNDTLRITSTIIPEPASPTGLGGERCGAGPIVISAVATNTVRWYDAATGGTLLFTGNTLSIPSLPSTTTFYAQNGNVCSTQTRTPVVATIHPLPNVNLGPDVIATGSHLLDAGSGFVSYLWNTSASTQTITVTTSGTYWVTVQDANSCSNSDTIDVTILVGIQDIAATGTVGLYPNPAQDQFTFVVADAAVNQLATRLMDINGRVLFSDELSAMNGEFLKSYDIREYAAGVYFLQVISSKGTSTHKLVIR